MGIFPTFEKKMRHVSKKSYEVWRKTSFSVLFILPMTLNSSLIFRARINHSSKFWEIPTTKNEMNYFSTEIVYVCMYMSV